MTEEDTMMGKKYPCSIRNIALETRLIQKFLSLLQSMAKASPATLLSALPVAIATEQGAAPSLLPAAGRDFYCYKNTATIRT